MANPAEAGGIGDGDMAERQEQRGGQDDARADAWAAAVIVVCMAGAFAFWVANLG